MDETNVYDERFCQISRRFKEYFNGRGNDYIGALAYFHCLGKEQKEQLRRDPLLGPCLETAIDEVMYGNNGTCTTN
jgi:hypothetical protein